MNRYVFTAAAVALSVVALVAAFALRGGSNQAAAAPESELRDGRHFGLIMSVDLQASPATVTFDAAELLSGEAANRAAAERGLEVPVPNDLLKINDDPPSKALPLSPDVVIRLIDWDRCCDVVSADPELLQARSPARAWGFWVTLRDGVVVKIEEQSHP